jgi:hypothetical protein
MRAILWNPKAKRQALVVIVAGATLVVGGFTGPAQLAAQPINPEVHRKAYEAATKDAEVVAKVRVLAAVCTAAEGQGKQKSVTMQLSLQVLDSEKGPLKKNEVVVVSHKVALPSGPGPGSYGYMGALRKFPFVPGIEGSVALRWDKEARAYVGIAGWVPTMPPLNAAIPTEVGKAYVAGDAPPPK